EAGRAGRDVLPARDCATGLYDSRRNADSPCPASGRFCRRACIHYVVTDILSARPDVGRSEGSAASVHTSWFAGRLSRLRKEDAGIPYQRRAGGGGGEPYIVAGTYSARPRDT